MSEVQREKRAGGLCGAPPWSRRAPPRRRVRDRERAAGAGRGPPPPDQRAGEHPASSSGDVADAVESDAALAIAVMRAANNGSGPPGRVSGVREAVEELQVERVSELASEIETYDPLEAARLAERAPTSASGATAWRSETRPSGSPSSPA